MSVFNIWARSDGSYWCKETGETLTLPADYEMFEPGISSLTGRIKKQLLLERKPFYCLKQKDGEHSTLVGYYAPKWLIDKHRAEVLRQETERQEQRDGMQRAEDIALRLYPKIPRVFLRRLYFVAADLLDMTYSQQLATVQKQIRRSLETTYWDYLPGAVGERDYFRRMTENEYQQIIRLWS
jgi:hypothetical protein